MIDLRQPAVVATEVRKSFGATVVLDGVDLAVAEGAIFATTGLDPRSRRQMWDGIRDLADAGVTILLTTQYLDEADELADRIAVLDHGRVVAEGTSDELKRRIPGGHIRLQFADPSALRAAAALLERVALDEEQLALRVSGNGDVASLRHVLAQLDGARIAVEELSIHSPDLDDVFFAVTGHPTTEAEAA
jgi:ABC-2 type transport system ATP-binding protein